MENCKLCSTRFQHTMHRQSLDEEFRVRIQARLCERWEKEEKEKNVEQGRGKGDEEVETEGAKDKDKPLFEGKSAFLHFAKDQKICMMKETPTIDFKVLARLIMDRWDLLPLYAKAPYHALHNAEKVVYAQRYHLYLEQKTQFKRSTRKSKKKCCDEF